jgi:hypothetical protein
MPQSSSNLLQIYSSWVESDVNSNSSVQLNESDQLILSVNVNIDPSLFGSGNRYDCNFQIIRAGDLSIASNNWISQANWTDANGNAHNGYPVVIDQFFAGSGDSSFSMWDSASNFNVHGGDGNNAEGNKLGMYILRVYMFVDTANYGDAGGGYPSLGQAFGTSQWAVADDVFFWCEL